MFGRFQAALIQAIKDSLNDFDDNGLIDLGNSIDEEVSRRFEEHDAQRKEEAQEAKAILRRLK